jgi:hypothetical protein
MPPVLNRFSSPLVSFALLLGLVFLLSALGAPERSLGRNARWVNLHGAWIWTALFGFTLAGALGAVGLAAQRKRLQGWSCSSGLSAILFWLTYLPISLWTMEMNWNGLFLEEPLWQIGIDFAIVGLLFQLAGLITQSQALASGLNAVFLIALGFSLTRAEQVMHAPSPISSSGSTLIRGFLALMLPICLLAGWQLAPGIQRTVTKAHEARD